jgi:predicted transcriptional regulator|tara:strand:- start:15 stop:578 length:564 start_codon:yes stop_codon:yes gene_type:complete
MFDLPVNEDVRKLRLKAGLTQTELASRAGVSQSEIARIESNDIDPRLSTLRKIFNGIKSKMIKPGICAKHIMKSPVIHAKPEDTISSSSRLMEKNDFSQLPILDNGIQIGSISEERIVNVITSEKNFQKISQKPIVGIMNDGFPSVSKNLEISMVSKFVESNPAILVVDKGKTVGIITKTDIIKLMY